MLKKDVKKYYGSFAKAARALGISSAAISQWNDIIPEKQAYRLEKITKGQLRVNRDLYEQNDMEITFQAAEKPQ